MNGMVKLTCSKDLLKLYMDNCFDHLTLLIVYFSENY